MNWLIDIGIFLVALLVGSGINWAIYTLAFRARPISPWVTPPAGAASRSWLDCIPIVGWWRLRREEKFHGRWFWIRPILIEVCYAAAMVWLFHFLTAGKLLPPNGQLIPFVPSDWYPIFAAHAILIALLTIATFIDFDEQTIPDVITLPGTILLLILTTIWPAMHLPAVYIVAGVLTFEPLLFTSKHAGAFPPDMLDWPGLAIALAIVWAWWLAIIPGLLTFRRGPWKAAQFYIVSVMRDNLRLGHRPQAKFPAAAGGRLERTWLDRLLWWRYSITFLLISLGVVAVWRVGGVHWQSLLTSLVGFAFAGGLVWGVRIGGTIGLRQEAMGFGDVTLMGMIGVVFGWQASLLVFFLSPATAVIVAVTQWLLTRRKDIAFGPYLALAAVIVIVMWHWLWESYARGIFALGSLVPIAIVFFLLSMTGMLWVWRLIREAIFARIDGDL
ncbi:prepilin peptidase [Anatilimnocola sp. NA78]|uniref:prepilin peptidase n=1 Tax=Anatilimnocola sp. NA78 TaxID=3415683 RepID=UPI003CE46B07